MTDRVESVVRSLWLKLLEVPAVDGESDFFSLGGDSLMLLEMRELLEDKLGWPIDLGSVLQDPTIQGMTEGIMQNLSDERQGSA